MPTCLMCNQSFPNRLKVGQKIINAQRRKFCLECSPYGAHNTRSLKSISKASVTQNCKCLLCGKEFLATGTYTRCNYCSVKLRRCRLKLAGVALLGGKCNTCGWNENPYILEFHHHDKNKEFTISNVMNLSWDKMRHEMEKCTLLCANCHRIEHETRTDTTFHQAVIDYNGPLDLSMFKMEAEKYTQVQVLPRRPFVIVDRNTK